MLVPKRLQFKIVTPLYIGGADASNRAANADPSTHDAEREVLKRDARIRVRPIVDMWRYWFRAVLGGVIGTDPRARRRIAEEETALFGGLGESATPSRIRVSLVPGQALQGSDEYTNRRRPLGRSYGAYLGYGLGAREERGALREHPRCAIRPNQTFLLEVVSSQHDWELIEHLVRLWSLFGGLGARHRRGFGSVRWAAGPALAKDHGELKTYLEATLRDARRAFVDRYGAGSQAEITNVEPEFDILHPDHCVFRLVSRRFAGGQIPGQDEALTAIRHQLRTDPPGAPPLSLGSNGVGWRQRIPGGRWPPPVHPGPVPLYVGRDHNAVSDAKTGSCQGEVWNAAFGAPVAYPTWKTTVQVTNNGVETRRPSPLSFRVLEVTNNDYRVLVLLFKSSLLGGADLVVHCPARRPGDPPRKIPMRLPATAMRDLENFVAACDGDNLDFR